MKIPLWIFGIVLLVGTVYYLQSRIYSDDDFKKILQTISIEVNKSCPKMEDRDTRLDSTSCPKGKIFQYNYTLIQLLKDSMDAELLHYSFEPAMINNARSNPELAFFRENKVTLVYHFNDKFGNFITKVSIGPDKYK